MRAVKYVLVAAGGVALGAAAAAGIATALWKRTTMCAVRTLTSKHPNYPGLMTFSNEQFAGLPNPVARYFQFALTAGQPIIRVARLRQTGTMRRDFDAPWAPFRAVEYFSLTPPGFVWDALIPMGPLVSVYARDSYLSGEGAFETSIAGLISVGSQRGTPELASGSLVRYLAEAAWVPTMLLPSDHLKWTPIDDNAARATLTDGTTTVFVDVQFGARGEIASISTMRYRDVKGVPVLTPWGGRYRDYTSIRGMMIPLAADAEWILPHGPVPYWRGEITVADYEFIV